MTYLFLILDTPLKLKLPKLRELVPNKVTLEKRKTVLAMWLCRINDGLTAANKGPQ